jgi:hypothetical protein
MKKLNRAKRQVALWVLVSVSLIFFTVTALADQKKPSAPQAVTSASKAESKIPFKTIQTFKKAKPVFELLKLETKGVAFKVQTTDPTPVQYGYFAIPSEGKIYEITPAHRVTRILGIEPWTETKLISLDEFLKNMSKPHL